MTEITKSSGRVKRDFHVVQKVFHKHAQLFPNSRTNFFGKMHFFKNVKKLSVFFSFFQKVQNFVFPSTSSLALFTPRTAQVARPSPRSEGMEPVPGLPAL